VTACGICFRYLVDFFFQVANKTFFKMSFKKIYSCMNFFASQVYYDDVVIKIKNLPL